MLEARTFRYPEDVFGPPRRGEQPLAEDDLDPRPDAGNRARGVLYLALGHVTLLALSAVAGIDGLVFVLGFAQLAYALPLMIGLGRRGRHDTVAGVALGAGITFLLNAAWLLLAYGRL